MQIGLQTGQRLFPFDARGQAYDLRRQADAEPANHTGWRLAGRRGAGGAATAAVLAGAAASYESLVLLTGRAMGAMSHPIIFGDLSVVLACIALFGLLYFEQAKNHLWMRLYLSFGAAMGVWGSLLSGSKGGWLSIIMVLLVFVWRVTAGHPVIWRFLGVVLISALVVKGVPMGLQMVLISLSMILMMSMVNGYGTDTAAAYGASLQLWTYVQMPAMAIGAACSTMAAQNVGAQRWDRVRGTARSGVLYNFLLTGVLILPLMLFHQIQLMVCAVLAQRYASREQEVEASAVS